MAQSTQIYALVLLTVSTTLMCTSEFSCIKHQLQINLKHYFYVKGKQVPIKIESSNRPSQLLSSYILQILLDEVMGYDGVSVVNGYNSLDINRSLKRMGGCRQTGCFSGPRVSIPETMVNLEVWSHNNINNNRLISSSYVTNAGLLGPEGRLGWYVPTSTVEQLWKDNHLIIDHWRAFQNSNVTSKFSTSEDINNIINTLDTLYKTHCPNCARNNAFISGKNCKSKSDISKCAILFSSYPEFDLGKLEKQINSLGLNVSVAYIGSSLNEFITNRSQKGLPTLFLSWTPNYVIDNSNYTRVHLPTCQSHKQPSLSPACDFQVNKFHKVVWSSLAESAPEAYHIIRNIKFSQRQYSQLLDLYGSRFATKSLKGPPQNPVDLFKKAACQWVKDNKRVWVKWLPDITVHKKKKKVYIGAMFPLSGPYWRLPGIVPGAYLAMEHINMNKKYLPDYELVLVMKDTQCKTDIAMKEFMHLMANDTYPIAAVIGPGCSDVAENIAGVSKHFNKLVVSFSAEALHINNREAYPLFYRTAPPITRNGEVLSSIFHKFNWYQVVLLAEEGQFHDYHQSLHEHFHTAGITVMLQRSISRPSSMEDAEKYLSDVKKTGTKIIILTSFEVSARSMMCMAFKKRMTAKYGYVWFLPHWFTKKWWDTNTLRLKFNTSTDCTSKEMLSAIAGHFSLSSAVYGALDSVTVANITVAQWKNEYMNRLKIMSTENQYSPYASYTYDSVWVFALALHNLLMENPTALQSITGKYTTRRLLHYMNLTKFTGVSGPVQFSDSDRTGNIDIHQFQINHSKLVGTYRPNSRHGVLELHHDGVQWYTQDHELPTDGSTNNDCGIERLRVLLGVNCDVAILLVNLLAVTCLAVLIIVLIVIIKLRYDKKMKTTRKRMEELGLMQDSNILSLDEWEINRNNVVLNRKLGEGAFGTVYGGEALVDAGWVAVAVKTLKVGSDAEQKLDFLSEAEMMKRFRHNNIVKLLGVCTRGEPAYTVMEFMLYGDLKTFLLDRRYLVGQNSTEAQDVSPQMLTKYAIDIACGLQYLDSLKYVHRDVACRNCLVDASKTVKISDFGMTRHTLESDYYRFNRKGMLPVRWMAPESLADGLFKHSSDIWSFGIILYEIMTFGSFPYQGLSNTQVLEMVREGKTLSLPQAATQQMKDLVTSCWCYNTTKRPTAAEIVTKLKEYPTLLQPCLDLPQPSLQPIHDDSNTYEDFQNFQLKLKKSSAISSQLKLFSSLDRLPAIKRSVSRLTLVGDYPSVFYWVRDFNGKKEKSQNSSTSDSNEDEQESSVADTTTTLLNYDHNSSESSANECNIKTMELSTYDRLTNIV